MSPTIDPQPPYEIIISPTVGSVAAGATAVSLLLSLIAGTTSYPTTSGFTTHSAALNAGPYPLR
ncbi:hypothetical protein ACIBG7_26940 [Nonomuraea sp. NPDC050328]|uniref:hypothetical protein n=1 Tax=Nonomuraea sp. NPDC050328 TaxID=3364361 RepID=UPI003796AE91